VGAFYGVVSRGFELGFRAARIDLRVDGLEHLPAGGSGIVAANHIGYLDFAFVMLGPPRPRREVRFLARGDLFERPLVGAALRSLGQIPVHEHRDPAAAMASAEQVLAAGGLVGLHPEATVNPTFLPIRAKSGAVRLAQRTGAPLIPCAVWGSQRLLTKWRPARWPDRGIPVRVRYGAPFTPPAGPAAVGNRELMARITTLVTELVAEEGAPAGSWWVPAELGGGAPRLADVTARLEGQVRERRLHQRQERPPGRALSDPSADPP
jgi:1-acyl-sn-glycerol-3-phosphate acyltransferase